MSPPVPLAEQIFFAMLAVLGWGVVTLIIRGTVQIWPVGLSGALSRGITLLLLATWVIGRPPRGIDRLRPRGTGLWLVLMGAVSIVVNLMWFAALQWTTATNLALLFRLDLVFVVLIGMLLGVERIGRGPLLLLPVMIVGLALVVEVHEFDLSGHLAGDLMAVLAALAFAINAFVIRHIMRQLDETAVAFYNHGMSTLGFIALALAGHEFDDIAKYAAQPHAWAWIIALGVVAAFNLPLYYAALRRMAVWRLRAWMLTAPAVVGLLEWSIWGISMTPLQIAGATIVIAGLAVLVKLEQQ